MWPFESKKRARAAREAAQAKKVAESQRALITAATATADAAHHVTARLKQHLEDAVRQFEATAALISDALLICDELGTIRAVNPAAEIVFAASSTDLINRSVLPLFTVDGVVPETSSALWSSVDSCDDGRSRLAGMRLCGESFVIDASMTKLDRADGSTAILMLVRDASSQTASERALEARERHFRTLFEISFDGILIMQDGRIMAANPAAGRMFGREPRALLAMSLASLLEDPEDSDDIISGADEQADAVRSDGSQVSLLFRTGTIRWNDAPAHLITVKEVSDQKQESILDLICVFAPDMRITFANEGFSSYYGSRRDKLIGSDIRDLIPASERDAFLLNLKSLTPTNPTRRSTLHAMMSNGEHRVQDWIDHATFDAAGKVVEYERAGRDITKK